MEKISNKINTISGFSLSKEELDFLLKTYIHNKGSDSPKNSKEY